MLMRMRLLCPPPPAGAGGLSGCRAARDPSADRRPPDFARKYPSVPALQSIDPSFRNHGVPYRRWHQDRNFCGPPVHPPGRGTSARHAVLDTARSASSVTCQKACSIIWVRGATVISSRGGRRSALCAVLADVMHAYRDRESRVGGVPRRSAPGPRAERDRARRTARTEAVSVLSDVGGDHAARCMRCARSAGSIGDSAAHTGEHFATPQRRAQQRHTSARNGGSVSHMSHMHALSRYAGDAGELAPD